MKRHLTFWTCWWIFCTFLYSFSPQGLTLGYVKRIFVSGIEAFFFLGAHIFLSYALMYLVIPRFVLKGKYFLSALATVCVFVITACLSAFISIVFLNWLWTDVFGNFLKRVTHVNYLNFFNSLLAGLRGAITIGGLAAAIKLMKHWYVKEQNNLHLQKQNVESQLQLLKAQVHPHFLFNTLKQYLFACTGGITRSAKVSYGLKRYAAVYVV